MLPLRTYLSASTSTKELAGAPADLYQRSQEYDHADEWLPATTQVA